MGSTFSGRWHYHRRRRTVEGSRILDLDKLLRAFKRADNPFYDQAEAEIHFAGGLNVSLRVSMKPKEHRGEIYDGVLRLSYEINGEEVEYGILFSSTVPNYGGERYYLHCSGLRNGKPCVNRASKLYLPKGEKYFLCRDCHRLTYRCVQEHDKRVDELVRNPRKLALYASDQVHPSKYPTRLFLAFKALQRLENED